MKKNCTCYYKDLQINISYGLHTQSIYMTHHKRIKNWVFTFGNNWKLTSHFSSGVSSDKFRKFVHTNLPRAGFEFRSLWLQAVMLLTEPTLLVMETTYWNEGSSLVENFFKTFFCFNYLIFDSHQIFLFFCHQNQIMIIISRHRSMVAQMAEKATQAPNVPVQPPPRPNETLLHNIWHICFSICSNTNTW